MLDLGANMKAIDMSEGFSTLHSEHLRSSAATLLIKSGADLEAKGLTA